MPITQQYQQDPTRNFRFRQYGTSSPLVNDANSEVINSAIKNTTPAVDLFAGSARGVKTATQTSQQPVAAQDQAVDQTALPKDSPVGEPENTINTGLPDVKKHGRLVEQATDPDVYMPGWLAAQKAAQSKESTIQTAIPAGTTQQTRNSAANLISQGADIARLASTPSPALKAYQAAQEQAGYEVGKATQFDERQVPVSKGRKIAAIAAGVGTGLLTMNPLAGLGMYEGISRLPAREQETQLQKQAGGAVEKAGLLGQSVEAEQKGLAGQAALASEFIKAGTASKPTVGSVGEGGGVRTTDIYGNTTVSTEGVPQKAVPVHPVVSDKPGGKPGEQQITPYPGALKPNEKFEPLGAPVAGPTRNVPVNVAADKRHDYIQAYATEKGLDPNNLTADDRAAADFWANQKEHPEKPEPVHYYVGDDNQIHALQPDTSGKLVNLPIPAGTASAQNNPQLTATIKQQAEAAEAALEQIKKVEEVFKKHPNLIGPLVGRLAETGMAEGIGTQAKPEDQEAAALLAGHLTYLFGQELRTMFGGRTNSEMQEMLKKVSAQMRDNPNLFKGFLSATKNNAEIQLGVARRHGYKDLVPSSEGATSADGLPVGGGKQADESVFAKFLEKAGGDINKAHDLLIKHDWK